MKLKKGFIKNNWPAMLISLIIVILAVQSWDYAILTFAIIFVITIGMKYKKYDEAEQEADDWWKGLSKEDKQKTRGNVQ